MKKVGVILLSMLVVVPVLASESSGGLGGIMDDVVCDLLLEFGDVFKILRTLAFVGAGFTIAGWAWGWISGGEGPKIEDLKKKGTGLLVGFIVLFGIGAIISAFMSMTGEGGSFDCVVDMWKVQN